VGLQGLLQTPAGDFVPARDKHCAKFKDPIRGRRATAGTLQTSVTFRTQDLRKGVSLVFARLDASPNVEQNLIGGRANVRGESQESSLPKMRRNDVIADHRT
jgi:hypothetical protein